MSFSLIWLTNSYRILAQLVHLSFWESILSRSLMWKPHCVLQPSVPVSTKALITECCSFVEVKDYIGLPALNLQTPARWLSYSNYAIPFFKTHFSQLWDRKKLHHFSLLHFLKSGSHIIKLTLKIVQFDEFWQVYRVLWPQHSYDVEHFHYIPKFYLLLCSQSPCRPPAPETTALISVSIVCQCYIVI